MKKQHATFRAIRKLRVALVLTVGIAVISTGTVAHAAAPTPAGMTTMFVTPRLCLTASGGPCDVNYTAEDIANTRAALTFLGAKIVREFEVAGQFLVEVPSNLTPYVNQNVLPAFFGCAAPVSDAQRNAFLDQTAFNATTDPYSLQNIARAMGADKYWAQGFTGEGIGVAIIDTGVSPVGPLSGTTAGADLSFDSQDPARAYVDGFGHGTHLAGITHAIAPDANIIDIKVGDRNGMNDVTQVVAAIEWVTEHRNDPGMNIKVLNLAYGVVSAATWQSDDLSRAAQYAWDAGIVVVVSAGNGGAASTKADPGVLAPAYNKNLFAVAAYDTGALPLDRNDDSVADFTSGASSSNKRIPDFAAPGKSIASQHVPNSVADKAVANYFCNPQDPAYKVIPYPVVDGGRLIRGSGTSQAAAAASGAIALMVQRFPNAAPDVLRLQIKQSAAPIPNANRNLSGEGSLDMNRAAETSWPSRGNSYDKVTGGAPIAMTRNGATLFDPAAYDAIYATEYPAQLARFTAMFPASPELAKAFANAVATATANQSATLDGDKDIFGKPYSASAHAALLASGRTAWTMTPEGEAWNGSVWLGTGNGPVSGSAYANGWQLVKWRDAGWSLVKWRDNGWELVKWRDADWELVKWRDASWASIEWR